MAVGIVGVAAAGGAEQRPAQLQLLPGPNVAVAVVASGGADSIGCRLVVGFSVDYLELELEEGGRTLISELIVEDDDL